MSYRHRGTLTRNVSSRKVRRSDKIQYEPQYSADETLANKIKNNARRIYEVELRAYEIMSKKEI